MTNPPADMPSGLTIFAIGFCVMGMFVLLLWAINVVPGKVRAWWNMSTSAERPTAAAGTQPVHVPVPSPGTSAGTSAEMAGGTHVVGPDTDAADGGTEGWNTPRLSLRLSDAETIALLAAQRGPDGKHRYSANAIHALIGGYRKDVLDQVRAIRDGAPVVYPPLTPEQAQLRSQLQLDRT
jgi:hypothetical protein